MKLNTVVEKQQLNDTVCLLGVFNPAVATKAKAGQFVILQHENSERIPLTIADCNKEKGIVYVVFQQVGVSTAIINQAKLGDVIHHFVGPLGNHTNTNDAKYACVIAGGVGCAIALPVAKALSQNGTKVDAILGFRSQNLVFFEEKFQSVASTQIVTNDGSLGQKGLVTDVLVENLNKKQYFLVFVVGPLPMMKAVGDITKNCNIKTIASMNPIMIDGTGMCGGCRLTVGGQTRFACVDGPEFDGHQVDFDEAMERSRLYREQERHAYERACNLFGQEVQ